MARAKSLIRHAERVVTILCTLLVADLVGSAWLRQVRSERGWNAVIEAELAQDSYRTADWAPAYWNELRNYQERWDPYYVYRVGDLPGPLVTVRDGVRRTYVSPHHTEPGTTVLMFGGSAAWGHGSRDEFTIPSWLARVAEEHGQPWKVVNYAESGWVNWQGLVYLLQKLADGERPQAVVFYSGVNELVSARLWPHVRRPLWNADLYPNAMTDWSSYKDRPVFRTWDFYRKTSLFFGDLLKYRNDLPPVPSPDAALIVKTVVNDYLADKATVEKLGQVYGFKTMFAWQLTVADKPHLTEQERTYAGWLPQDQRSPSPQDWWVLPADVRALYDAAGDELKARSNVADLKWGLAELTCTAFIDWMHSSECGNEGVARALYQALTN